jgi:hypothetical protein
MHDTKTTITDTEINEEQDKQSDARIILGPLVKYAAVGFVLVGIIITTAIMLDRQFNSIDREVAELRTKLAQSNTDTMIEADADTSTGPQAAAAPAVEAEDVQQQPAIAEVAETEMPAAEPVAENSIDTTPAVTQAAAQKEQTEVIVSESTDVEDAVAEDTVVEAAVAEDTVVDAAVAEDTVVDAAVAEDTVVDAAVADKVDRHSDFFDKSFDQMIAERNNYLNEMDRVRLEEFKASRERHVQFMRERLARQERRIQEMIQRNQELYDYRAANIKEMQQWRENFLPDRI